MWVLIAVTATRDALPMTGAASVHGIHLPFVAFFAVFFTWAFPANQVTANWATMSDKWSELRREWEYSHTVNALVILIPLCSVTLSGIAARQN